MRKIHILAILSIVALAGFVTSDFASAQEIEIVDGVEINGEQAITVVFIGIAAGFLVAYQGYRTTPEDFDTMKFFDGVIYAVIGAVPLAIGTAMTVNLDVFGYVTIFFAAIGVGSQIKKARQRTIPSNATEEEIEDILKSEG